MTTDFIVDNGNLRGDEQYLFFQGDEVEFVPVGTTLFDLLVRAGVFKSKSQARKNWKKGKLLSGFNYFHRLGKKRVTLCVLDASEDNLDTEAWLRKLISRIRERKMDEKTDE